MKAFILPLLSLLCLTSLYGQKQADVSGSPDYLLNIQGPGLQKSVTDTLFPQIFGDACSADGFGSFGIQEPEEGFVIGTNSYGDIAKLQRFFYDERDSFYVKEVGFVVADYDEAIEDAYLFATVYNDIDRTSTSFGPALALSDSVRVGDIDVSRGGFTSFTFPEPVLVTNDSFLIGMDFLDVYASEETGYIGLVHTREDCGSGRNVLEIFPTQDNTGFQVSAIVDSWNGLNVEIVAYAVIEIDSAQTVALRPASADYRSRLFPNPATGRASLEFTAPRAGRYTTSLSSFDGRTMLREVQSLNGGERRIDIDLAGVTPGIYLLRLDGPQGTQTSKLVVR